MLTVLFAVCLNQVHYAESRYAEFHSAGCHYDECHQADCRGVVTNTKLKWLVTTY